MITLPKLISQQDSRWANILLGFNTDSTYNIKNYGCLLSCLAMGLCYYGYNTDPEDLNNKLKKAGGFAGGGNYVWHSVEKITDKMKEALVRVGDTYPATDDQVKQIKDALDDGYPVISGIQVEVEPAYPTKTGFLYESYKRGWLTEPTDKISAAWALRIGDWNEIEAKTEGNRTITWLNGVKVVDFQDTAPNLFEGFFALQLHTGGVAGIQWRELYVEGKPLQ